MSTVYQSLVFSGIRSHTVHSVIAHYIKHTKIRAEAKACVLCKGPYCGLIVSLVNIYQSKFYDDPFTIYHPHYPDAVIVGDAIKGQHLYVPGRTDERPHLVHIVSNDLVRIGEYLAALSFEADLSKLAEIVNV